MDKKFYSFNEYKNDKNVANYLLCYPNDLLAKTAAESRLCGLGDAYHIVVQRVDAAGGDDATPNYFTIFDGSNVSKTLALTEVQKYAVKELYDALARVQNLDVCLVEYNGGICAFNGENVKEWDASPCSTEIRNVSLHDMYYAGPVFYEQSADDDEIYVKFYDDNRD